MVANCLSRPPDVLSLPRSTKVPSGSLAAPVAQDGSPGASSSVAVVTPGPVLDMAELARAQDGCQETQELHAKLAAQDVLISGHKIWCNSSLGVLRPLVLVSMQCLVFNRVHSLAHPGICATRRMLTSRFVWTSGSSDVNTWCRECQQCARAKIQPQERAAVDAIPVPLHKFSHMHMDLVGPWPRTAEGHTHLLTIVDRTTRWAEAIPLQSTTAQVVAVLVLFFVHPGVGSQQCVGISTQKTANDRI